MTDLPKTPDFDFWPVTAKPVSATFTSETLRVKWAEGATSQHHVLMLRENSPDAGTIHPKAREMRIAPTDLPADLSIADAAIEDSGALSVTFSDHVTSTFHPGWLHGCAWFGTEETATDPVLWRGEEMASPPTFDGPAALEDEQVFLKWLEALRDLGVARLRGLPQQDGLLETVVTRIGPVRESNFGRQYVLQIKDDPDSQAYTSDMLLQHIDLPTRETPFGLQFLYTRENTVKGGDGLYVDGYRIAEDLRVEEPEAFESLRTDIWEYNNRSQTTDYRGSGPVVETDPTGRVTGIRYNTFLRAPMKAPIEVQARAYHAYRRFCARAQDPCYLMRVRYEPGDLIAFDNRRALHGRSGYEATSGSRFIEGIYSDRDDLASRIRIIKRHLRAKATGASSL